MKRFYCNVIDSKINEACKIAEKLLTPNSNMLLDLLAKNDWKYNSGSGEEVYQKIVNCKRTASVFTYKSKWPWSAALAYSDGLNIYFNTRKLGVMDVQDIVATLCHEYAHVAGFSHGNNYPSDDKNKFSVPYHISSNIGKWL